MMEPHQAVVFFNFMWVAMFIGKYMHHDFKDEEDIYTTQN